jgi:hypothetical protein
MIALARNFSHFLHIGTLFAAILLAIWRNTATGRVGAILRITHFVFSWPLDALPGNHARGLKILSNVHQVAVFVPFRGPPLERDGHSVMSNNIVSLDILGLFRSDGGRQRNLGSWLMRCA